MVKPAHLGSRPRLAAGWPEQPPLVHRGFGIHQARAIPSRAAEHRRHGVLDLGPAEHRHRDTQEVPLACGRRTRRDTAAIVRIHDQAAELLVLAVRLQHLHQ